MGGGEDVGGISEGVAGYVKMKKGSNVNFRLLCICIFHVAFVINNKKNLKGCWKRHM